MRFDRFVRRVGLLVVLGAAVGAGCSDEGAPVVAAGGSSGTTAATGSTGSESTTETSVVPPALDPVLSNGMLAHLTYDGDRMCVTLDPAMGAATAIVVRTVADQADVVDLSAADHCAVVGAEAHVVVDSPSDYELVVTTATGEVSGPLG